MNNGWIKLHRKLLDNPICGRLPYLGLWVVLLLLANHNEDQSFIWNKQRIVLKPGQFLTGRKKLSKITRLPASSVEDILTYFENEGQIRQQKTTKHRVITIVNWESFQNSDNKPTTSRQQADTFKNTKKYKNITADANLLIKKKKMDDIIPCDEDGNPIPQKKKKIPRPPIPPRQALKFDYRTALQSLKDSSIQADKIIAVFFEFKDYKFSDAVTMQAQVKRNSKIARELSGYTYTQLKMAMQHCEETFTDPKYPWGLETVLKRITEVTN